MFKTLFVTLQLSISTVVCLYTSPILAQVTSDGTVNTQVNQDGNVAEITGGETRGDNLFHSFEDFSVPTDNEAFFNNASDIANIFSRVTGGNISNIDGLIRANDSASLFLINPAGIVFGNNARLDIGGSFYGSSASSILFEGGEFSAVDLDNPPLLTVNAPIGLGFRSEPGDIVNRSFAQNDSGDFAGLEVGSQQTIALVGGDIRFDAGNVTARGGNIYLGGLNQSGTVGINEDGSINFPADRTLANISLTNFADVNVVGTGFGNISINAQNFTLTAGEFGSSVIRGGIAANSTSNDAQAGNIAIDVAENITLNDSSISNKIIRGGVGNSGAISLNALGNISLQNGARVDTGISGEGNAGRITIDAEGDVSLDGVNELPTALLSNVQEEAEGNSGGVSIEADSLSLTNGALIESRTRGNGDAADVNLQISNAITFNGLNSSPIDNSGVYSGVEQGAQGQGGEISISAGSLLLEEGASIESNTSGTGDAGAVDVTATGDITLEGEDSGGFNSVITSVVNPGAEGNSGGMSILTNNLNLTDGGLVSANTNGNGDAGVVEINATGDITLEGENSGGFGSDIVSQVGPNGEGNSGGISISTNNLNLTDGGRVNASTFGRGDAGVVEINATGDITLEGEDSDGFNSSIESQISLSAEGNSGGISILTTNLNLTNGGRVNASTFGRGDAGVVEINATGDITLEGEDSDGFNGSIISQVGTNAEGNSGGISISTTNLNLTDGGRVNASTFGTGDAGAIEVTATGDITVEGESSEGFGSGIISLVNPGAEGNAGGITISTGNLSLVNSGLVNTGTFGNGNAGNITIDATESININGSNARFRSGISANALNEDGNGGDIFISTGSLTITNGGTIEATNFDDLGASNPGKGRPGNITLAANSIDLTDSARIEAATQFNGEQSAIINLQIVENITLEDNSFISARAFQEADGGNLNIDAGFIIAFPSNDTGNDLVATAEAGRGGTINLSAEQVFGLQTGNAIASDSTDNSFIANQTNDIDASSNIEGLEGNININIRSINPLQGTAELPNNVANVERTIATVCDADTRTTANNALIVKGKGGVPPEPGLPLASNNVLDKDKDTDSISTIPAAIETSIGKIQPARGIKVTKSGKISLTAYRTNNAGERISDRVSDCGGV